MQPTTVRSSLSRLAPAFLAASLGSIGAAQQSNVLIILADDVGVDKVGAYGLGPAPPPTPNIDALAANGVLFRNCWANPACAPTRALIQTGRYSFRTGVGTASLSEGGVLRYEETTIPELLDAQGAGYAHAAFGKWHLSDARNGGRLGPNLAGWSHYAGALRGIGRSYFVWPQTVNGVRTISTVYNTTQTVDDALAWVRTAPEPWVCYLAFPAAHHPFHEPPQSLHTYPPQELVCPPPTVPEPPGGWPCELKRYKAMVEAMDTEIGRLLRGLGGQLARTDVIFAGDNGSPNPEPPFTPGRGKHTPYQGGVLVPLIISGPSVQSPGRAVDSIVGLVDVFATVAEICGADPEVPWVRTDSVSMLPYLRNAGQPALRNTILAETFRGTARASTSLQYAFRDQRYKLLHISWQQPPDEFYDLLNDPYESNNLLAGTLTSTEMAAYQALRAGVAALRFPQATATTYGVTNCVGSSGRPTIGATGLARLGGSYNVSLTNAAGSLPAVLLVGSSRSTSALGSLPLSLTAIGAGPGCVLYASPEFMLPTATDPGGGASIALTIPLSPVLEDASVYHTWLALDPGAPLNPLGMTTSNGLEARIGPPSP